MRRLRLLIVLGTMTLAFVLFQNFGLIVNSELQEQMNKEYRPMLRKYDPNKTVKHIEDFYAKNVVFVENEEPKYFDHKQFAQDTLKQLPLYNRLKNWVDISDSELAAPEHTRGPASVDEDASDEVKVKIDPLKTRAMVRYMGSFNADLAYVQNESNVQVKVYKNLDENTKIQVEHDAVGEKTWIQYQFNW